ncbi:MAG TPA: ABC transporter permease, partial [Bacteroidales bacterium]|nr:ABC transporter permease [Bacteroidales bacterium]
MKFFEFDTIREIFSTMRQSKLRTFLTGFSVAWGIFMLIVLLGSGKGLQNGVSSNFSNYAVNMVNVWPRRTNMPYKGFKAYRRLRFRDQDMEMLKNHFPQIDKASGIISLYGSTVSYGKEYGNYGINGVMPDYKDIRMLSIEAGNGRFINHIDMSEERKVVVINQRVADNLFREEEPLGKYIQIGGIAFMVVGLETKTSNDENGYCYIPHSTAQTIYNRRGYTDEFYFTVTGMDSPEANEAFTLALRKTLARSLIVHPDDTAAIGVWNMAENYVQTMRIFSTIQLFVFIIGLCTLVAGIVGVGNIMVITVKERTREFGIKKAIGASPSNILNSILIESVIITGVFGYIGMVLGIGTL